MSRQPKHTNRFNPNLESLEDRFCMSATAMMPMVETTAGQDGNDLLIVNNGDGSDFLEGGEDIDTVQVNGSNTAGCEFFGLPGNTRDVDDFFAGDDGSDPLEGGDGLDTVHVNADNTAGDSFRV